jgi:Prokaryotic glutathione synthetase, ATP-grasp domain
MDKLQRSGPNTNATEAYARNLLIVQTTHLQGPSDWIAIKQRIERDARDIEVRIANNGHPNSVTARWQVQRPSLVFSPVHFINFVPRGGAIFCGHILSKDEQLRRLSSIDILTPRTATLSSASAFDPKEWGDYVIVKPNNGNAGKGIKLVRTIDLAARYDELIALANDQMLVQPYIDPVDDGYPTEYRVLTMFGRPLYCVGNRWRYKRPPLAQIAADPSGVIATHTLGGTVRWICNDPEIIALAERAHGAFPECPVLGVDIIRESQSGRLYVLEVNPHGAVWHLSSPFVKKVDSEYVRARYAQFNALDRAADLLIQKTRAEAC